MFILCLKCVKKFDARYMSRHASPLKRSDDYGVYGASTFTKHFNDYGVYD